MHQQRSTIRDVFAEYRVITTDEFIVSMDPDFSDLHNSITSPVAVALCQLSPERSLLITVIVRFTTWLATAIANVDQAL